MEDTDKWKMKTTTAGVDGIIKEHVDPDSVLFKTGIIRLTPVGTGSHLGGT